MWGDDGINIGSGASGVDVVSNTVTNTENELIGIQGGTDILVANNSLRNSANDDGIEVSGPVTNLDIVDNSIRNADQDGIDLISTADQVLIANNEIRNSNDDGIALGSITQVTNTVVRGNVIDTVGDGDQWLDIDSTLISDVEVTNNTFTGTGGAEIVEINGDTDAGDEITLTGGTNTNETPIRSSSNLCDELGNIAAGSPGFTIVNPDGSTVTCGDN